MRLYSFTNMYTSGIHAGIQTAHLVHEMMRKYEKKNDGPHMDLRAATKLGNLYDWADNHKTIIVKCGGYHSALVSLYDELKEYSAYFQLPMGRWRESKDALNNAQTAVGIVVPKEVYGFNGEGVTHQFPYPVFSDERTKKIFELKNILDSYRMAT